MTDLRFFSSMAFRSATSHRAEQLGEQGLAGRQARSLVFSYNLIDTLRRREVEALGEKIATEILRADSSRVLLGCGLRWLQYFCAPLRRTATVASRRL